MKESWYDLEYCVLIKHQKHRYKLCDWLVLINAILIFVTTLYVDISFIIPIIYHESFNKTCLSINCHCLYFIIYYIVQRKGLFDETENI